MKKLLGILIGLLSLHFLIAAVNEYPEQTAIFSDKEGLAEREIRVSELNESESTTLPEQQEVTVFSDLEVHFIDVGQGDSTLILCGGESLLIDAGGDSKGTTVQLYLKKHQIEKLDYVIATHPDADHIGGLDVILYKFDCGTILMSDITNDTKAYRDVADTLEQKNYRIMYPRAGDVYSLGDAVFEIIGPVSRYTDDNDNSIVIRLIHGENTFLFVGDAEKSAESDLLQAGCNLEADVLKVGHHGSNSSTDKTFLKTVNPWFTVISCGKNNAYGHPHTETLDLLRENGSLLYRTDDQGSIVAYSDGIELTWSLAPSENWQAGGSGETDVDIERLIDDQMTGINEEKYAVQTVTYILNRNTKKFHRKDCSSVKDIKEKNKIESTETREEILTHGYVPCKKCNP